MTIFNENLFSNPQIFAGRPPKPPPCDPACRELLKGFWMVNHGCMPIVDTTCDALKKRAKDDNRMGVYLVKQLSNQDPGSGSSYQVNYDPSTQVGLTWFGRKATWMKSGVVVLGQDESKFGALISTPFHSRDRTDDRNGIYGRRDNIDEGSLVYRWEVKSGGRDVKRTIAMEDGSIAFSAEGREQSRKFRLDLDVVRWEGTRKKGQGKDVNKCINAFTLVLGVNPGGEAQLPVKYQNTETPSPGRPNAEGKSSVTEHEPWVITIQFGDVTAEIMETRSEMKIEFATSGGTEAIRRQVTLNPSAISKTSSHAGPQPYHLTFIPVWNGVLFSDSEPSTDSWPARIVYIPKNTKKNAASEIHDRLEKNANDKPPRWGKDGEKLPMDNAGNCVGVATDVDALLKLPDKDEFTVKFGKDPLRVFFERCGGSIKFKPVYFTNCVQTHLLIQAEGGCADNNAACAGGLPFDADRIPQNFVVPVVHYSSEGKCIDDFSIRSGLYSLGQGNDKPLATLSTEMCRCERFFRRPLQLWGHLIYAVEKAGGAGRGVFRTGEGALRNSDLPIVRAQSFSINRSLDGTQGSIKWDRFSPAGLLNRPSQHVGAVQIVVAGGVNTSGGVVFTGIAMGNAVQSTPDANEVELPLRGREVKMTDADGGLRLINSPFFDGYDHREVFEYLCCYAGIPCRVFAGPYKLPANVNLLAEPVVNFKTGTPVWDAISELQKLAGTLAYFDRFGVLNYRDVNTTTGVNFNLADSRVETYDDKPDLSQMRDTLVIAALVSTGEIDQDFVFSGDFKKRPPKTSPALVTLRIPTIPAFPWSKMMFYVVPAILKPADLKKMAAQISKGISRPRAAGSVTIPGNANIDLLDTINGSFVVTGITHNVDINSKRFGTTLNLELLGEGGAGIVVNACKPNGGNDDDDGGGGDDPLPPAPIPKL